MLRTRVIPCLQLINESLVKTVKFKNHSYIGDPINTVRIFNELEVDELCFLDIRATVENRPPNFKILAEIADECFMPLAYGGGVKDAETAKKILSIGFEKIVLNTVAMTDPNVITQIAMHSGTQSVIGSIDIKKNIWGGLSVYTHDGTKKVNIDPIEYALKLERLGVGELLITSVDRDGTWSGFELDIIKSITSVVTVPVIANGGAGTVQHISDAVKIANASAVALGSMVVFQNQGMGVLVNFPDQTELKKVIS
jgi:cyclase